MAQEFLSQFNILEVESRSVAGSFFRYRPQMIESIPDFIKLPGMSHNLAGESLENTAFAMRKRIYNIQLEPGSSQWTTYSEISHFYARVYSARSQVGLKAINDSMDMQAWLATYVDKGNAPIQLMKNIAMAVGKRNKQPIRGENSQPPNRGNRSTKGTTNSQQPTRGSRITQQASSRSSQKNRNNRDFQKEMQAEFDLFDAMN